MTTIPHSSIPSVTDEDIQWVTSLLGLGGDAFCTAGGADSRDNVLRSMATFDVAACPGSGKTTLLVAKLAILSRKWRDGTRGICVLSHTNAARREIEIKLGGTETGRRMLAFPHFIGTIHGFVNDFLAVPWIRSLGFPIKMIDTEVCQNRRWWALPYAVRTGLEKNSHGASVLTIESPDCSIGSLRWGRGILGKDTPTYSEIRKACRSSLDEGYFCYDEMLMWAYDLLKNDAHIVEVIRDRFPILFIDEAQDNSDEQSKILHQLFIARGSKVIRQRFGDSNQAIFDFGAIEATEDRFPDGNILSLPNSHRFGQMIADLADPLGLRPHGLKGLGPKADLLVDGKSEGDHTIFLFDVHSAKRVLDAYGDLIARTFSKQYLPRGIFKALGQIHRPPEEEVAHKFPQHVQHYWSEYDPELARQEPKPSSFLQQMDMGRRKSEVVGETSSAIEMIASGVLRLAELTDCGIKRPHSMNSHRQVSRLLAELPELRGLYHDMIYELGVQPKRVYKEAWDTVWCDVVRKIATALAGTALNRRADSFLAWSDSSLKAASPTISQATGHNVYRCKNGDVQLQVSSIHSVKGETHAATLVLETYFHDHNLQSLLPWLEGSNTGGGSVGVRQRERLKSTYVAMTRPTHLLCLALKRSSSLGQDRLQKLKLRGWRIVDLSVGVQDN